jgi:hypothetical protein
VSKLLLKVFMQYNCIGNSKYMFDLKGILEEECAK